MPGSEIATSSDAESWELSVVARSAIQSPARSPLSAFKPPPAAVLESSGELYQTGFKDIPFLLQFTGNNLYFSNKSSKCILK